MHTESAFMQNDLTFFTNDPGSTLLDRFQRTLRDVKFFDILVGYFRTSGFDRLHESFTSIDKIRILVGLNVDRQAFEIIDAFQSQSTLDFESHKPPCPGMEVCGNLKLYIRYTHIGKRSS
jgi:hypothetical protein